MTSEYIAGLFDGEGCVRIHQENTKFKLKCAICMTYLPILQQLKIQYGGSIHKTKGTNKPVYHWQICTNSAKLFLEDIYPYTYVKKDEIKKALEFVKICIGKRGRGRLTEEEIKIRIEYKFELQRLKRI